jgi:hypothetical protein
MYITRAQKFDDGMQRIGMEVLKVSLFSYGPNPDYQDNCLLTHFLLSDRSHPLSPAYSLELSESTARLQCDSSALPNITTASWIFKCYHHHCKFVYRGPLIPSTASVVFVNSV